MAEHDRRVASKLAADLHPRFGHRITGAFVKDVGVDGQQFAGGDEAAHLGFLDGGQKRHALEFHQAEQQPAAGLRHRFDQQHAGHQRVAREMPLENGARRWNLRLDRDRLRFRVEVENAVDELEIFELHGGD
jgi:hypothetical protein